MQRFIEDSGWRMTTRSAAEKTPVRSLAQQTDEIEAVYKSIDREGTPDARPLPKNVLFVAGIEGAPFRYRVTHLMEQLALLGIETTARYCRDEESLSLAGEHEILVLYRVPWGAYTERIVARARSAGALVVFSVDDLIFEPSLGRVSALHGLSRQEVAAWFNGIRLYRATLNASDAFLGSTEALARMAANAGKPCFVHRNTLSFEQLRLSEKALATSARKKGEVRLAYLSGTRTHEKDFDTILEPLVHVMERRPETRLLLAGHLLDRPELRRFGKRIERVPFMTWQRLPELLARIDVNLAPLEIGSAFSDSKSELKYIEAAAVETATVAAGTEPFRRAIRHCETGMIASTPDEWYTALEQLVSDEQMRARIGKAAREDMYLRYTPRVAADALAETLRALAELRPRTALTPLPPVNDLELAQIRAEGIGIGHAALEPSGEEAGPGHLSWSEPTPRIFGEHRVRQRFVCPAGLHRIDVVVGTHCGIPRHPFRMLVREPTTGIELARCIEDGEQACDNAWMAFEFEPVRGAEGRTLEWVFDVPSASDEDGPSLWFDRQENGGGGFADRTDIILAFRTWARQTEQDAPQVINNDPLPDDPLPADQALAALIKRIDQERQRNGDLSRRVQRLEQRLSLLHSDLILGLRPLEKVRRMLVYRVARKLVRVLTRR
jgi:glycosyltransferase involved in cell wall biosynthesis